MKTLLIRPHLLFLGAMASILFWSSCSQKFAHPTIELGQGQSPQPSPRTSLLTAYQGQVCAYLAAQLDLESPKHLPTELGTLLSTAVPLQDIPSLRQEAWRLWREANITRYEQNQGHKFGGEVARLIWDLPAGERMPLELFTKGRRPEQGFALYINLHGGGKDPDAKTPWGASFNDREWEAARTLGRRYADTGSVYFVPRMADDRKGRWYLAPQRTAFRRAWQLAVLSGAIDPDRIYLLGISEGGYGSHRLALYMPDYFAGIGPMAAAEPLKASQNLRNVAFRLSVGANDRGFGRNTLAQAWANELTNLAKTNPGDFVHEVQIQEGRGHGIDYSGTAPWLEQHTRRSYPNRVTYRYYNMTADYPEASYSSGVYYLDFRGLKPNGGSLDIDLTKQGNEYDLKLERNENVTGKIRIYLDKIDYTTPITVRVNGTEVVRELARPNTASLVESLALWGDPTRIYPAYVEVSVD